MSELSSSPLRTGLTPTARSLRHARSVIGATIAGLILFAVPIQNSAQAAKPQSGSTSTEAAVGNAQRGKELFVKNGCYECHGYWGQGGSYSGVRLAPNPLPWQAIAAFIRNPPGLNPAALTDAMMPPYSSKLVPDQDVQDIYAYLKSIPPGTDVKNIPNYKK